MNRSEVIGVAKSIGWGVRDLNDNEHELTVRGPNWQVYNDYMPDTGWSFWAEDEAWTYIIARVVGGVPADTEGVEFRQGEGLFHDQLNEMMNYKHPSLKDVPRKNVRGNVYALAERKQGNAPSVYTMSVGIEVALKIEVNGFYTTEFKTFHVPCNGFDLTSQAKAMQEIYDQFLAWKLEHIDIG